MGFTDADKKALDNYLELLRGYMYLHEDNDKESLRAFEVVFSAMSKPTRMNAAMYLSKNRGFGLYRNVPYLRDAYDDLVETLEAPPQGPAIYVFSP